jgi:hypothetical protein
MGRAKAPAPPAELRGPLYCSQIGMPIASSGNPTRTGSSTAVTRTGTVASSPEVVFEELKKLSAKTEFGRDDRLETVLVKRNHPLINSDSLATEPTRRCSRHSTSTV